MPASMCALCRRSSDGQGWLGRGTVWRMLYFKYGAAAIGTMLWGGGLIGQWPDLMLIVKYVGISALMLVLAII